MKINLGINIDHAATLRNMRGENDPSILEVAFEVQRGGADSITMHLREDRRHIRDEDIFIVKNHVKIPINFEMAATREMLEIALELNPTSVCIVPEKRQEITTEGGFDIKNKYHDVQAIVDVLTKKNIAVFIFVEPDVSDIEQCMRIGAAGVEIHTGAYARSFFKHTVREDQLQRIRQCAKYCKENKFIFHAGHGLNYHNIYDLLEIENLAEVNIGHAVLSQALISGIGASVRAMKNILIGNAQ
ncbi:MAG: pyridoxine 5'-phosphate synthase [Spirochaetia bacterium]|nr:pyridoxine 5'-phosphate synthase [Spirochaetia bacterium]